MHLDLGGTDCRVKGVPVSVVKPGTETTSWYVPAFLMLQPVKVATPALVVLVLPGVQVRSLPGVLGVKVSVTVAEAAVVTVLPPAS